MRKMRSRAPWRKMRLVRRFLFHPKTLETGAHYMETETRWLEIAEWFQCWNPYANRWRDEVWADTAVTVSEYYKRWYGILKEK